VSIIWGMCMRLFLLSFLLLISFHTQASAQEYNFACSTLTHSEDTVLNTTIPSMPEDPPVDCKSGANDGFVKDLLKNALKEVAKSVAQDAKQQIVDSFWNSMGDTFISAAASVMVSEDGSFSLDFSFDGNYDFDWDSFISNIDTDALMNTATEAAQTALTNAGEQLFDKYFFDDETGESTAKNLVAPEDHRYDGLCLRNNEIQGSRPQVCMVHKRMPAIPDGSSTPVGKVLRTLSPLNLSPWYLISMQDPIKEYHPYYGPLYRGESNDASYRSRMSQPDPEDNVAGCIPQIKPQAGGTNPFDPFWMRAERDNCANQYILTRSRYARFVAEAVGERPLPVVAGREQSMCQPLRLIPLKPADQEYVPSDYIYNAWAKLLANPALLVRRGKAEAEPLYSRIGVEISKDPDNRIWPPTKDRTPFRCSNIAQRSFGKICLNGIVEAPVERILDPTHPFSPRWDYRGNERDTYSPWTIIYTQNPLSILYGVRCAGDNLTRYFKVDMMSWRQKAFHRGIMRRLLWSIVCRYLILTFYDIVTWECWDGKISIFEIEILTGVPWNCKKNTSGGQSGDNTSSQIGYDYGQCCATKMRVVGLMS
jgi:hypothetical protein